MEAIAEPFFQIPQGVNYDVDRTKNIISDCWNVESESADAAKLQEQAFSVEEPKNPAGGPAEVALGLFIPREDGAKEGEGGTLIS